MKTSQLLKLLSNALSNAGIKAPGDETVRSAADAVLTALRGESRKL